MLLERLRRNEANVAARIDRYLCTRRDRAETESGKRCR